MIQNENDAIPKVFPNKLEHLHAVEMGKINIGKIEREFEKIFSNLQNFEIF